MTSTGTTSKIAFEVCPSCGEFTDMLNSATGFCLECSPRQCSRCESVISNGHSFCIKCQRELWWERNADQIELYIYQGYSLRQARRLIVDENRAVCIACSEAIPGRNRETTLFCSRHKSCKTAKRRYLWKIEKGVPKDIALEQVLEQLREGDNGNGI